MYLSLLLYLTASTENVTKPPPSTSTSTEGIDILKYIPNVGIAPQRRTKQTARMSTGGIAPRKRVPTNDESEGFHLYL